jgi:hypothetical protein
MKPQTLDSLIWPLIFGGMALLMLGLWTIDDSALLGHGMAWSGTVLIAVGAVMIWLRSRLRGPGDGEGDPR